MVHRIITSQIKKKYKKIPYEILNLQGLIKSNKIKLLFKCRFPFTLLQKLYAEGTVKSTLQHPLKGIFQPFELGGETILIPSAVKN
jgi:hypothetical protein